MCKALFIICTTYMFQRVHFFHSTTKRGLRATRGIFNVVRVPQNQLGQLNNPSADGICDVQSAAQQSEKALQLFTMRSIPFICYHHENDPQWDSVWTPTITEIIPCSSYLQYTEWLPVWRMFSPNRFGREFNQCINIRHNFTRSETTFTNHL